MKNLFIRFFGASLLATLAVWAAFLFAVFSHASVYLIGRFALLGALCAFVSLLSIACLFIENRHE